MEYPRVITNSDGAGVVDEVGPGVPAHWLGKRVWLYNGQRNGRWMGTAAEYIALDVDLVTELPAHVSFAEGATLGVPCMTAHRCVFLAGPVQGACCWSPAAPARSGTTRCSSPTGPARR